MPKHHYLKNEVLNAQVVRWREDPSPENGAALAESFYLLARNASKYIKISDSDLDDGVQFAVARAFEVIDRYDPAVGKAFNYFTSVMLNEMKQKVYRHNATWSNAISSGFKLLRAEMNQPTKRTDD